MSVHSAARSDEYEIFEGDIDEHRVRIFVRKTQAPRGDLTMRTPTFLCRFVSRDNNGDRNPSLLDIRQKFVT